MLEDDVVARVERDEPCAGDPGGQPSSLVEGDGGIARAVDHQRRHADERRECGDVDVG